MNHQITLPSLIVPTHLTVKRGLYEAGDQITITQEGTRNQAVAYVTEVITEKVYEHYCILLLSETRPAVDDLPVTVG